jgi:hypothetical protein
MVPSSLTTPIPILLAELSNPIAIILPAILYTFPAHTNLTPQSPTKLQKRTPQESNTSAQRASAQASAMEELGLGQV